MKVLLNALSQRSGGAVSYLRNLAPPLAARFAESGEHSLHVLIHESQKPLVDGVPQESLIVLRGDRPTGWRRLAREWGLIDRLVREIGADVVYVPYQVAPPVRGARLVLMFRNMDAYRFQNYPYGLKTRVSKTVFRALCSRSLRRADRVIAVSDLTRRVLVDEIGVDAGRIRRIYHGRDEAFSPDGDMDEDRRALDAAGVREPYILTPGSLMPYRRSEDVIVAFGRIAADFPDLRLVIAGGWIDARYGRMLRGAIMRSGLVDRIATLGHVSVETMRVLYRRSRLCAIASEVEACPNIAIEAMSSGCTIVSSRSEPFPEVLGEAARFCEPRRPETMAEALRQLLFDSVLRDELSRRARERARRFSWNRCMDSTFYALIEAGEGTGKRN